MARILHRSFQKRKLEMSMKNKIQKNIFLVDIHPNELPTYIIHIKEAYQKANPDFNVELISLSLLDVVKIYNGSLSHTYAE